jgi:GNAT superfamily N-acetyltransferase
MIVGDAALAKRLERFQAEIGAGNVATRDPSVAAAIEVAGGKAVFFGVDSPITQAIGIGIGEPVSVADVDRLEEFFRSHGSSSVIHITPWSDPAMLTELSARQYQFFEFENVFAQRVDAIETPASDPAITVRAIDRDEAPVWARICASGFATEGFDEDLVEQIANAFSDAAGSTRYLASIGGVACGAAASVTSRELSVVGLFGAATLPEYRRRGVQSALVARRLADAAGEGCELALVTTLPGSSSHRNVRRRGFELLYTKTSMKRSWAPAAD